MPLTVFATDITHAVAVLKAGELVAFPTETVYGLGAHAFDADAVLDAFQLPHVPGSDHCPVGVVVRGGAGE